jgi:hypothetical protein
MQQVLMQSIRKVYPPHKRSKSVPIQGILSNKAEVQILTSYHDVEW